MPGLPLSVLLAACPAAPPADADRDGWLTPRDCDDGDPFVHPGANEFCDGRDDDCDGAVDSPDPLGQFTFYRDQDGDGFGVDGGPDRFGCDPGDGWVVQAGDCDDSDPLRFPGRLDGCNDRDDDCDGTVDENPGERFLDADGDGHGRADWQVPRCEGTSPLADDCDDDNTDVHPEAPERCDGFDDDCDGLGDDLDDTVDTLDWYPDTDGDGFGVESAVPLAVCVPPSAAWSERVGDCDDVDPAVHPGAVQTCVPADTNCDGFPGDTFGWFDPARQYRATLSVTGGADGVPAEVSVDLGQLLADAGGAGEVDPTSVVVAVQDCAGAGGVALPTAFVDGLSTALGPGDPSDPLGDGEGLLTFVLGPGGATAAPLDLYFGVAPVPEAEPVGTAIGAADVVGSGLVTATIDPDRAGTVDALSIGAVRVASQADAREGNGVEHLSDWTELGTGVATVHAAGPVFSAVSVDGTYDGTAGTVRYAWWWFTWSGSPAIYGRVVLDGVTDLFWEDPGHEPRYAVRPLDLIPLDRGVVTGTFADGFASMSDGSAGVAVGWVRAPADPAYTECDGDGCRIAATEGQGASAFAVAGTRLLAHPVLALIPFEGGAVDPQVLDVVRAVPTVTVGIVEPLGQ